MSIGVSADRSDLFMLRIPPRYADRFNFGGRSMPIVSRWLAALSVLSFSYSVVAAEAGTVPTGPLPRTVVPSLVALELRLDPRQPRFNGTTRIEAKVSEPTTTIWMHGRNLTIIKAEVSFGGQRLALTSQESDVSGVLELRAPQTIPAGNVLIEIAYEAPFGELQGAYRVRPDGRDYIVTQMEPLGARQTFPGFDEPSFKQPWDITLIVPERDIAVTNSREARTQNLGKGWKKVVFERTAALPSYLIAFAVGPWDLPQGPDIAPSALRSEPIKLRGVAARGQGARMRYSLANTPQILLALEEYFGIPYPFDKLDNLAAPDFWAGAMENAGLIVYRDTLMFPDASSAVGQRQSFWGVSAHELAHQWFGDLVTMQWWDDLWLNEAFATWMGNKIAGQLQPQFHTDRNILEGALGVMDTDSLASTRRIREPITNFTQIQSAFDGITYQKGGAMLAMFENHVGATRFRDGIRSYLRKHARGNATSSDLIAAVAAQSEEGTALEAAFKSYVGQPGVPLLSVDVDCSGERPALLITQQRYVPIGSKVDPAADWAIPMTVRYADGAQVREEKSIVTQARARWELQQAQGCPTWVMPNGHGAGYFRFTLAARWQEALAAGFAQLDEREQRVYADSITSAYDAGLLSSAQLVSALPRFAAAQTRQTVTAGFGHIDWIKEHLLPQAGPRAAFLAAVADVYRPRLQQLGDAVRAGESDDERLLRTTLLGFFAETLEDSAVREKLSQLGRGVLGLGSDGKLRAAAVPEDLRGLALSAAVVLGGKPAFESAEKHLRAVQDAQLRGQLLLAMGSAEGTELAQRARALVLAKGLLRRNEIFRVLGPQASQRELRPQLRDWLDTNFEYLAAKLAPSGAQIVSLYAAGMCSATDASAIETRFTERMENIEGGPLELKQVVESILLCAAAKAQRSGDSLQVAVQQDP
jgi:alanyl aminopeptidase